MGAIVAAQRQPNVSLGSAPIRPNLDLYAVAATYSDRREISLAKGKFRLRTDKFRLRNDFVSPSAPQGIEIVGYEISDFVVSCDFKDLRPVFFRAFLRRPFSIRPSGGLVPNFVFSELIDSTSSIPEKVKR
jgi:hypothetical protein